MLAAICRRPQHVQAVEQAGGLTAAVAGIASLKKHREAAAACCDILAPMARFPQMATQMIETGAISTVG